MDATPRTRGYRMPAEWERHEATWLAWPHKEASWPGCLEQIPPIWVEMIRALHQNETVHLCVNDAAMESEAQQALQAAAIRDHVVFHRFPTNDAWMRDAGPIFLKTEDETQPRIAAVDWVFNSWGEKYGPWDLDDAIPEPICNYLNIPCYRPGLVLEGGSIDVNGQGLLLTTEQCLLNKNRNAELSREEIEQALRDYLGVNKVLWLGEGIVGDDTDGHIDDIARFVNTDTVVAAVEEDPADDNFGLLQDNLKRLQRMRDEREHPLNIVTLPMPAPVVFEGQRLPASYLNFYIANGVVLVPVFDDPKDAMALKMLQDLFPQRRIVPIMARTLVWGLGACHCVTQQQPEIILQSRPTQVGR